MSSTANQFSAADSALGYLYQARLGLLWARDRCLAGIMRMGMDAMVAEKVEATRAWFLALETARKFGKVHAALDIRGSRIRPR
ncbi:hypothetical protein CCP4SC76_2680006 [Gammaproteobacteria bacterium]